MCLVGIFKRNIGIFSIKFITFLVGSIAFGRVIFSMLPTTPGFYNPYFVFEVIAASIKSTLILCVLISTSTKTGTAPNCIIGLTVVGKPAATPITSSPFLIAFSPSFFEVNVLKATKLAEEPEFTKTPYFLPNILDISSSNLIVFVPDTNDLLSDFKTSMTALISSSS